MRRGAGLLVLGLILAATPTVRAQPAPGAPPTVGVVKAAHRPVVQSAEFIGRIEAAERVNLLMRVTAVLDQVLFTEGAEVKKGDLLFRLEQAPFKADVQAKQAAVAQMEAQLKNAEQALFRAQTLLHTTAGQQATVDTATANAESAKAQLQAAKAQLLQSQISLGYTEIRAPISGKIGRSSVTPGNVVSPGSGTLATIVSQDPINVTFPVSVRTALTLRQQGAGGVDLRAGVVKVRLPDGRIYGQVGKIDFVDNTVSGTTDTILLRGVLPNPPVTSTGAGGAAQRELIDNELVTVILEDAQPVAALTIPRAAVLTDQRGDYVFVVDAQNKAQRQAIWLGQSTPSTATVVSGLNDGETVIVEGIQRARAGQPVTPEAASEPAIGATDRVGNGNSAKGAPPRS